MKKAKRTKRLLAGLLALLLAVTGVPLSGMEVQAEDGVLTEGDYRYEVNKDGNSVTITGYNGSGGDVTIPDTIDGKNVTAIGNSVFSNCTALTGLTISGKVVYIGEYAFSGCTNLANLSLPYSITTINDKAFYGCTNLANFTIPEGITSIGESAFEGCTRLTSITIPDSATSIFSNTFKNCSSLESIKVTEGNAVYDSRNNCNAIIQTGNNTLISGCKNSHIPEGITSIAPYAFQECNGLEALTIPDSVTSIGECAFYGCSSLTALAIPNNVTSIGYSAFKGCSGLKSVNIPNNLSTIEHTTFKDCSSLESLTIPSSVDTIWNHAFENCSNLANLNLLPGCCSYAIHSEAFLGCTSLTSLTIPNIGPINSYAFGYKCNEFDKSLKEKISGFTIYGKKGSEAETYATENGFSFITSAMISDASITLEGEDDGYVWDGTPKTPAITVKLDGKTLTEGIDYTVFYNNNTEIGRAEVIVTGMGSYHGSTAVNFSISETGWEGDFKYKVNEDGNSVTILKYDGANNDAKIPETIAGKTVTVIGEEAFSLWSSWFSSDSPASLTIPASVTSIGSYAFYHWRNLKSITIPSTVTSIGYHAFGFCEYEVDPDDGGDISDEKVADFTIYGESGSAAEAYATKNGFPFNQPATGGDSGTTPGTGPSQNGGSQGTPSQADLSKATVTLEKDAYPYDGKAKTPAVTVTLNGKTLSPSTDYTVSYTDNVNVGTAKATVTGKGNYKGSVTKTFTITKANNPAGNNGTSDGNGSAGTSNSKQPITCKKRAYTVAYGTKPFRLKVTSNGSLTYKSSNRKIAAVGKTNGKVTIKNTGITYITAKTKTDSVKITIKVRPAKPKVKSLSTGKNRKLTVKWAKDKRATGYQVQISTSKNFKKNVKKQNTAKTAYTFKKLKAGSKYYVRLRSFKKSGKTTLYSAWSSPKRSNKIKQ